MSTVSLFLIQNRLSEPQSSSVSSQSRSWSISSSPFKTSSIPSSISANQFSSQLTNIYIHYYRNYMYMLSWFIRISMYMYALHFYMTILSKTITIKIPRLSVINMIFIFIIKYMCMYMYCPALVYMYLVYEKCGISVWR